MNKSDYKWRTIQEESVSFIHKISSIESAFSGKYKDLV